MVVEPALVGVGGGEGGESAILTSQRETLTGQIYSVSCGQAEADCAEILMSSSLPLTARELRHAVTQATALLCYAMLCYADYPVLSPRLALRRFAQGDG